jgi:hypothetical protein
MLNLKGIEIVNYQDKLYYVYRRFPKSQIRDGFINDVKELWHCDVVLKKKNEEDETLVFLVEIPDAIIVEGDMEVEKS